MSKTPMYGFKNSKVCCPECGRDCFKVELAGYRTWCQQCWDKHVAPLSFPKNGGRLEKNSSGVWQWVEVLP